MQWTYYTISYRSPAYNFAHAKFRTCLTNTTTLSLDPLGYSFALRASLPYQARLQLDVYPREKLNVPSPGCDR